MFQNTPADYLPGSTQPKGLPGMLADSNPKEISSYAAEGAIACGLAVTLGTNKEKQVKKVTAANQKFLGVAIRTTTLVSVNGAALTYADKDAVSVLEEGRIWVPTTVDVTAGDAAYVDVATGKFTNVATDNLATGGSFVWVDAANDVAALKL